ncbi:MAG: 16S rRNA (cytosine(1402)-N(4))-methyltransferase RsmH [Chloroflexi bacterium]|nr:16S rRNA (cytosine(1402)-N(4))-methyltransferase RsmH [Chloroflexota bacterium]
MGIEHIPVLFEEVLAVLDPKAGERYIDCTVGAGGHAAGILERSQPDGRLLGLDADPEALRIAARRLERYASRFVLVNDNFVNLGSVARASGFFPVDGILFDLGVSSMQLDSLERGFSFRADAPLDMRFGPQQRVTAYDLIDELSEQELAAIIARYGEEPRAKAIARAIVAARQKEPIRRTGQLTKIIERVVPSHGKIHPATRTFQALRIAVNDELENLESALGQAVEILAPGGRMAVMSFHSLEDRVVKQFFALESSGCICPPRLPICTCDHRPRLAVSTRKPIVPSEDEKRQNPRSRSAKLRAARRLA